MKFGQLLEYNRNIFPEKSYTKCVGEASPRPSLWINSLKCYKFVFILCPSRGPQKYIKTKVTNTCSYL